MMLAPLKRWRFRLPGPSEARPWHSVADSPCDAANGTGLRPGGGGAEDPESEAEGGGDR
jgi:hypothetical protein